jgi:hypothetical protein
MNPESRRLRMTRQFTAMFILCLLAPGWCFAAEQACDVVVSKQVVDLNSAHGRVFRHPASAFAVLLFPEDALANHIGVMYYERMLNPKDGAWSLDNHFWEVEEWASDVNSFAWADDGVTLYVGTSEVYGTGCAYRLNLLQRKAERIFPSAAQVSKYRSASKGFSTEILAVDEQKRLLRVRLTTEDETKESFVALPNAR